nr:plasmid pRiA4b ORF-3 family protein [Candidatus Levybacteria bacterium]
MRTFKLKIILTCWEKELVWRVIEIPENKTLHQLHLTIQKVFGWYNDHLYSFFMSNNRMDRKGEYTSPIDIEESGEHALAATEIKLKDLNLQLKKKFLYLYDFGDNLDHEIEVVGFGKMDDSHKYPQLIGAFGAVPEQYAIRRADTEEDEDEYFDDCYVCQGLKEMGLKHETIDMRTGKLIKQKKNMHSAKLTAKKN